MKQLAFLIILLAIYASSLLYKNGINEVNKNKEPVTLYTLRKEKGTPVKVVLASESKIDKYYQVSGFVSRNGTIKTEVPLDVVKELNVNDSAFTKLRGKEIQGKVTKVSKNSSLLTGLYPVEVELKGIPADSTGDLVVAKIPFRTSKKNIVLPRDSVSFRSGDPKVYILNEEGRVKVSKITVGSQNSDFVTVTMGVSPGEKVIISDRRYLDEYQKVYAVNEMEK